jgi:hypothetical protein
MTAITENGRKVEIVSIVTKMGSAETRAKDLFESEDCVGHCQECDSPILKGEPRETLSTNSSIHELGTPVYRCAKCALTAINLKRSMKGGSSK